MIMVDSWGTVYSKITIILTAFPSRRKRGNLWRSYLNTPPQQYSATQNVKVYRYRSFIIFTC